MATGLDKRQESVPRVTLRLSMGRECLSDSAQPKPWEEDNKKSKAVRILGKLIQAQQNLVYERYVLIRV